MKPFSRLRRILDPTWDDPAELERQAIAGNETAIRKLGTIRNPKAIPALVEAVRRQHERGQTYYDSLAGGGSSSTHEDLDDLVVEEIIWIGGPDAAKALVDLYVGKGTGPGLRDTINLKLASSFSEGRERALYEEIVRAVSGPDGPLANSHRYSDRYGFAKELWDFLQRSR